MLIHENILHFNVPMDNMVAVQVKYC